MVATRDKKSRAGSLATDLKIDTSSLSAEGKLIATVIISSLNTYFENILTGMNKEISDLRSTVAAL